MVGFVRSICSLQSYQTFWLGAIDSVLIINSWYLAARLPFQRVFPSIIADGHGLCFSPQRLQVIFALFISLALLWPWFIPVFIYHNVSSINNVFGLGPLGQLPICLVPIPPGGRRGNWRSVLGQCHHCSSNGRNYGFSACARRPWLCSLLFHRDSPNDGDTDSHHDRSVQ